MTNLQPVDLLNGPVRAAGIVELEHTPGGIVSHRMPRWARSRHNDIALSLLETMPSGGRLEMTTDATSIELDVQLTLLQLGSTPVQHAAFDLTVNGQLVGSQRTRAGTVIVIEPATGAISFVPGEPTTITFDGLASGNKMVEIWLPQAATVTIIAMRTNGTVTTPPQSGRRWVHYGSSISHCLEATQPTGAWPVVAARLAGVDLQSFAFAGQCQLDPFAGRMIAAQPADLISLKLGINVVNADSMRERTFVPAVHGLLDTIRESHPNVPLLLITPIVCPVAEDHPGPTLLGADGRYRIVERSSELSKGALALRRIRELEAEIVSARQGAGDTNLYLMQGTDLFGSDDINDLPDGLHPNPAGYQRMGERFHQLAFREGPFA
jgi:archaellum component FlaF (FlaF/FlaG flagellin family)